jgi:hypothetical protein
VQPELEDKVKDLGTNDFQADPNETITVKVSVDKKPFLCAFQDPPDGSVWKNISHNPGSVTASRQFTMPAGANGEVDFNMQFDTQIADDDDDKKATYTVVFSGSAGGNATRTVIVPENAGPISREYTFTN